MLYSKCSIKSILVLLLIVFQLFNINKGENKDVYLSTAHDPEGSELAAGPGSTNVIPKDPPSIGKQGIHPFAAASSDG